MPQSIFLSVYMTPSPVYQIQVGDRSINMRSLSKIRLDTRLISLSHKYENESNAKKKKRVVPMGALYDPLT